MNPVDLILVFWISRPTSLWVLLSPIASPFSTQKSSCRFRPPAAGLQIIGAASVKCSCVTKRAGMRSHATSILVRVSVTKFLGIPTMKARVVRLIPVRTDVKEVQRFFDFLIQYRLTQLYQLQFTQTGFFEQLQAALGNSPSCRWNEGDRTSFLMHWNTIEEAFRKSYGESLNITAADALVVLLRKYPYERIIRMESWVLARIFQASWKELYALSFSEYAAVDREQAVALLRTA